MTPGNDSGNLGTAVADRPTGSIADLTANPGVARAQMKAGCENVRRTLRETADALRRLGIYSQVEGYYFNIEAVLKRAEDDSTQAPTPYPKGYSH